MKHPHSSSINYLLFSLILSVLFASTAGRAQSASDQKSSSSANHDPAFIGEAGIGAITNYQVAVRQDLVQGKYEKLEKLAAELRRTKARFPGGAWKLNKFYQGLSRPTEGKSSEQEWITHLPHLQKWVAAYPKSITARVALGSAYTEYAWSARGSGYSDTVSEEGWRLYRERLVMARKTLEDARQLPEKCPHWYAAMETIAMGQAWEREDFEKVFEEAIAFEPQYHYLYTHKANYLLPRWHGEPGDVEKFADEMAARQGSEFGPILYFLIVEEVAPRYKSKLFSETTFSWSRTKSGFQDLEKQFGMSAVHLNAFCRIAGWAGDRKTAVEMLDRISDRWDPAEWGTQKNFDDFKAWAKMSSLNYRLRQYWMVLPLVMAFVALMSYRITKRWLKQN